MSVDAAVRRKYKTWRGQLRSEPGINDGRVLVDAAVFGEFTKPLNKKGHLRIFVMIKSLTFEGLSLQIMVLQSWRSEIHIKEDELFGDILTYFVRIYTYTYKEIIRRRNCICSNNPPAKLNQKFTIEKFVCLYLL